jgi:hypothetical protein
MDDQDHGVSLALPPEAQPLGIGARLQQCYTLGHDCGFDALLAQIDQAELVSGADAALDGSAGSISPEAL